MQPLLDALRDADIPVQHLGLALQDWLIQGKKELNATDPDLMQQQLLLEDTRAFFLKAYGIEHTKWEPDYAELTQEKEDRDGREEYHEDE